MTTELAAPASRGRILAFRILAITVAVVLGGFALVFLVATALDDDQSIHALHNTMGAASTVPLMVVPLLLSARNPGGSVASFRVLVAAVVGAFVASMFGGTLASGGTTLAILVALLLLHPARAEVARFGPPDLPLLAFALVAAIPAAVYGAGQAHLQATRPAGDPHAEFEHYVAMASAAFSFVLAAAAAAFGGSGARVARWLVGVASAAAGTAYLAYPDHVSSIGAGWAAGALAFGIAYVAVAEIEERRVR